MGCILICELIETLWNVNLAETNGFTEEDAN